MSKKNVDYSRLVHDKVILTFAKCSLFLVVLSELFFCFAFVQKMKTESVIDSLELEVKNLKTDLEREVAGIKSDLEKHDTLLYGTYSNPGLSTRVYVLENSSNTFKEYLKGYSQ